MKMTNNQYQEFCKTKASECWEKIFAITEGAKNPQFEEIRKQYWKEFDKITNEVEIIPFKVNCKNEKYNSYINVKCNYEEIKENCVIYRGRSNSSNYRMIEDLELNCIIDTGYSSAYYNDNDYILFSYCEGDVTFEVFNNLESYQARKENAIQWYKDNY